MAGGHRYRDWSGLHGELLEEIILKISFPEDVLSFSYVCGPWQTAFERIKSKWRPANPLLLLSENTHDNPECLRKVYNPGNNKCYNLKLPETFGKNCWGSDHGWIVTFGLDLEINLFNPLTKSRLGLPSTDTMMPEVAEELIYENCHSDCKYKPQWMRTSHILKACVLKTGGDDCGDLLVAVIHAHERVCSYVKSTYLSIAKPGDARWILIETPRNMFISDVLFWKDSLWFVNQNSEFSLWYVNLSDGGMSFKAVQLLIHPHRDLSERTVSSKIYLVESFNHELLLVNRRCRMKEAVTTKITRRRNGILIVSDDFCRVYDEQNTHKKSTLASTTGFEIYKLDLSSKKWELDDSFSVLAESSMFLGKNTSLFVGAPKVGTSTCRSNCIYFTGDHDFKSGHDIGICYLDCKRPKFKDPTIIEPFYDGGHTDSDICNPFWFTPLLY